MSDLFPTGMSAPGHPITFEYLDETEGRRCIMRCGCGWSSEVEPSILPWTVNETQVKFKQHIEDEALKDAAITRSFRDRNGDSYTLKLSEDQVKLDCYLMGSILGGTGTECVHTINGPKVLEFFAEARAKDSKDLDEKVAAYVAKDWRELHDLVSKHQTDVSVWEETDWDEVWHPLTVSVVGEARVGNTLTAQATSPEEEGPFTVTYLWKSGDPVTRLFARIEGAESSTYTIVEADRGRCLTVFASATFAVGPGYAAHEVEDVVV